MYEIRIDIEAKEHLGSLDEKSNRIIKDNLGKLIDDPYPRPQNSIGNVEKVGVGGEEAYRMHISRNFTAFYTVNEEEKQVVVFDIVDIDKAHKMYD